MKTFSRNTESSIAKKVTKLLIICIRWNPQNSIAMRYLIKYQTKTSPGCRTTLLMFQQMFEHLKKVAEQTCRTVTWNDSYSRFQQKLKNRTVAQSSPMCQRTFSIIQIILCIYEKSRWNSRLTVRRFRVTFPTLHPTAIFEKLNFLKSSKFIRRDQYTLSWLDRTWMSYVEDLIMEVESQRPLQRKRIAYLQLR